MWVNILSFSVATTLGIMGFIVANIAGGLLASEYDPTPQFVVRYLSLVAVGVLTSSFGIITFLTLLIQVLP